MDCLIALKSRLETGYKTKGYNVLTSVSMTLEQFLSGNSTGARAIFISFQSGNPVMYYEDSKLSIYEELLKVYIKTNEGGLQVINQLIMYLDGYKFNDDVFGIRTIQIVSCLALSDDLVNHYEITVKVV